jgi:hypothetical protein
MLRSGRMDPKPHRGMLLAPPFSTPAERGGGLRFPDRRAPPPVDEHVVQPEVTRDEIVRGRRVVAQPALAPHADQHFRLDYVIGAYLKPGYVGSTDLLTRQAEGSNFATDTCVRKAGDDPSTHRRHLEEIAFDVVHEQGWKEMTERAEDLVARGVRRVFAILVKKREVSEWRAGGWTRLAPEAAIEDACLVRPLAVGALLDAAADDAVARALVDKGNPVIAMLREDEHRAGREEGLREGQLVTVARMFQKRLGRDLRGPERAALAEKLDRLGVEGLDDARDALAGEALAAWLVADDHARR